MGIFDCDTHCYETRDAFTRYMPKELLDRSIFPVRLPDGTETILAGPAGRGVQQRAGLGFDHGLPPGFAEGDAQADGVGESRRDLRAEADAARVPGTASPGSQLLEQQGVEQRVLYPVGMALSVEHYVDRHARSLYANLHSFNRWFDETWGFNGDAHRRRRPCCRCVTSTARSTELEHVLDRGARVVLLPTGPAYGRSPGDPYFDPVWARLNEAGVVVALPHHGALVQRAPSHRRGVTSPTRRRGTCRRGSGRTSTANARSRTRSRR